MKKLSPLSFFVTTTIFVSVIILFSYALQGCSDNEQSIITPVATDSCSSVYGTGPIKTVYPVTVPVPCEDGVLLQWQQTSAIRFACLNYPSQADSENLKWPLVVYLHGSLFTPASIYTEGRDIFNARDTFQLSDNSSVKGFILLSPEGRIADPPSGSMGTGEGFHWDEWYRDPNNNLDILTIDHFIDEVVDSGNVDESRIYVFGWSNGAYMSILYATWRSNRIAAMGQYAGANPWYRTPCPIPMSYIRQVPLYLLRNLCDAFVPCDSTNAWISELQSRNWPFVYHSLDYVGDTVSYTSPCNPDTLNCSGELGLANHFRWPREGPLMGMLSYFKEHPLPDAFRKQ